MCNVNADGSREKGERTMNHIPYELAATVQADREREAEQYRFFKTVFAGRQVPAFNLVSAFANVVRSLVQRKPPSVSEATTRFSQTVH